MRRTKKTFTFAVTLLNVALFSVAVANAWHGGYHPSFERIPHLQQGPLLPDPNIPFYQNQQWRLFEDEQRQQWHRENLYRELDKLEREQQQQPRMRTCYPYGRGEICW